MIKKFIVVLLGIIILAGGAFFYLHYQIYSSQGENQKKIFLVEKGQGAGEVSLMLEQEKIISDNLYFNYYLWKNGLENKILPGSYEINTAMTIPEIVKLITAEQKNDIKITFPEGWTAKKMAERLAENGFDSEDFLTLVNQPEVFSPRYDFLSKQGIASLEGYLFPDTYLFLPETSAEKIIEKMLNNFITKVDADLMAAITNQGKDLQQIIIMASIIEREVNQDEDRALVSGIFWNRIKIGQALQSCATIAYVLGENKKQFTYEETRIASPYNTYINPGLPPQPISNPGLLAIKAAIYPQKSNFNYFLNNPKTQETIFSSTLDEHNFNKAKVGL